LPALLVPFPFAADDHQTANAAVYEKASAAVLMQQDSLDIDTIQEMLRDLDDDIISKMSKAMKSLSEPEAAAHIATVIEG
jgi:UDP-N-acetylglucosamine--N-acetylmuramyl-(pentapeptide) pyrophosphoryl-undecaprenol N-acetylglucosamine transferase